MDDTFVWWFKWGLKFACLLAAPIATFSVLASSGVSDGITAIADGLVALFCLAGIVGLIAVGVKRIRA